MVSFGADATKSVGSEFEQDHHQCGVQLGQHLGVRGLTPPGRKMSAMVTPDILVADSVRAMRVMICQVLRTSGYRDLLQATNQEELYAQVDQRRPKIVVVAAEFPGITGLEFTRLIRAGFNFVPRETSIVITHAAPTRSFLEESRIAGVDEVVAVPFTTHSLMARIRSAAERPRPFVDSQTYVGPCRRRLMLQEYKGPLRRMGDPEPAPEASLWKRESNRTAARLCIQKMSEYRSALSAEHHEKLREVYTSVTRLETRSAQESDEALGEIARNFGLHLSRLAKDEWPELAILSEHIDALHQLVQNDALPITERSHLVERLRTKINPDFDGSPHSHV